MAYALAVASPSRTDRPSASIAYPFVKMACHYAE